MSQRPRRTDGITGYERWDDLQCPYCGEWSPNERWIETEEPCLSCGIHPAAVCPRCGQTKDLVVLPDLRGRFAHERGQDEVADP